MDTFSTEVKINQAVLPKLKRFEFPSKNYQEDVKFNYDDIPKLVTLYRSYH